MNCWIKFHQVVFMMQSKEANSYKTVEKNLLGYDDLKDEVDNASEMIGVLVWAEWSRERMVNENREKNMKEQIESFVIVVFIMGLNEKYRY